MENFESGSERGFEILSEVPPNSVICAICVKNGSPEFFKWIQNRFTASRFQNGAELLLKSIPAIKVIFAKKIFNNFKNFEFFFQEKWTYFVIIWTPAEAEQELELMFGAAKKRRINAQSVDFGFEIANLTRADMIALLHHRLNSLRIQPEDLKIDEIRFSGCSPNDFLRKDRLAIEC